MLIALILNMHEARKSGQRERKQVVRKERNMENMEGEKRGKINWKGEKKGEDK